MHNIANMAKDIKIIQCPKCGSTDKTEIKPGFFKCNNCNTEYYLNADNIKINDIYNQLVNQPAASNPVTDKKKLYFAIGFLVLLIAGVIFSTTFSRTDVKPNVAYRNTVAADTLWLYAKELFLPPPMIGR